MKNSISIFLIAILFINAATAKEIITENSKAITAIPKFISSLEPEFLAGDKMSVRAKTDLPLSDYSAHSLTMIASMNTNNQYCALLSSPEGKIISAKISDVIGSERAKIISITDNSVVGITPKNREVNIIMPMEYE